MGSSSPSFLSQTTEADDSGSLSSYAIAGAFRCDAISGEVIDNSGGVSSNVTRIAVIGSEAFPLKSLPSIVTL